MIEFLLLMILFGTGTAVLGWWSLAVVAAVWSLLRRGPPWRAAAAAALTWIVLLSFSLTWGPLARLLPRLGDMAGTPTWVVPLMPPLFAWLLAWSAARLVARPR